MSHFFRHLLERALAPTASLQPRLGSRFENVSAPAVFAVKTAQPRSDDVTFPTKRPFVGRIPNEAPLPSPPPECAGLLSGPPLVAVKPVAVMPTPVVTPAGPQPASRDPLPSIQDAAPADQALHTQPCSVPGNAAGKSLTPPEVSPATLLIERVIEPMVEPPTGRHTATAMTKDPAQLRVGNLQMAGDDSAPFRRSLALQIPSAPAPHAATASDAPPSVHVSIGRVDIRAMHTPPPSTVPVAAADRPPLVSLETYLSRRDAP